MDKKLKSACDQFELARRRRLQQKENEGWEGWNCHPSDHEIPTRLLMKAANIATGKMTEKDCVDVANFANFIFYYLSIKK